MNPESMLIAAMIQSPDEVITAAVDMGLTSYDYIGRDYAQAHDAIVAEWRQDKHPQIADVMKGAVSDDGLKLIREAYRVIRADRCAEWIEEIKAASITRQIREAVRMAGHKLADGEDGQAVMSWLSDRQIEITSGGAGRFETLHDAGMRTIAQYEAAQEHGFTGVQCPFKSLNEILHGYPPGMHILAARPKVGKSSMAAYEALEMARKGTPVYFASLEMPADQVADRYIAGLIRAGTDPLKHKGGSPELMAAARKHVDALKDIPIHFAKPHKVTLDELMLDMKTAKLKHGIEFAVIDHIGKIARARTDGLSQYDRITTYSNRIADEAKHLSLPVRVVCHVGRQGARKADASDVGMEDLRESGHLEQDASSIVFLNQAEHMVRCAVAANRNGETGEMALGFNKALHTWVDMGNEL